MTKSNFTILVHRYQKYLEWDQTVNKRVYRRAAPLDIKGPFFEEYNRLMDSPKGNRIDISDKEGEELYTLTLNFVGKRNV